MAAQQPPWVALKGMRRIMAEYKALDAGISAGREPFLSDLQMVKDDPLCWRLSVSGFDNTRPAGRELNADLQAWASQGGRSKILMEVTFPHTYPDDPFFLRVVEPRCRMYTGHVTAGGSICIEALTHSGTPGSWQSTYCLSAIMLQVITNFTEAEVGFVRTATGPGGATGPLRVDLPRASLHYGTHEAQAAFARMLGHHQQAGWGGPPPAPGAQPPAATAALKMPLPAPAVPQPAATAALPPAAQVGAWRGAGRVVASGTNSLYLGMQSGAAGMVNSLGSRQQPVPAKAAAPASYTGPRSTVSAVPAIPRTPPPSMGSHPTVALPSVPVRSSTAAAPSSAVSCPVLTSTGSFGRKRTHKALSDENARACLLAMGLDRGNLQELEAGDRSLQEVLLEMQGLSYEQADEDQFLSFPRCSFPPEVINCVSSSEEGTADEEMQDAEENAGDDMEQAYMYKEEDEVEDQENGQGFGQHADAGFYEDESGQLQAKDYALLDDLIEDAYGYIMEQAYPVFLVREHGKVKMTISDLSPKVQQVLGLDPGIPNPSLTFTFKLNGRPAVLRAAAGGAPTPQELLQDPPQVSLEVEVLVEDEDTTVVTDRMLEDPPSHLTHRQLCWSNNYHWALRGHGTRARMRHLRALLSLVEADLYSAWPGVTTQQQFDKVEERLSVARDLDEKGLFSVGMDRITVDRRTVVRQVMEYVQNATSTAATSAPRHARNFLCRLVELMLSSLESLGCRCLICGRPHAYERPLPMPCDLRLCRFQYAHGQKFCEVLPMLHIQPQMVELLLIFMRAALTAPAARRAHILDSCPLDFLIKEKTPDYQALLLALDALPPVAAMALCTTESQLLMLLSGERLTLAERGNPRIPPAAADKACGQRLYRLLWWLLANLTHGISLAPQAELVSWLAAHGLEAGLSCVPGNLIFKLHSPPLETGPGITFKAGWHGSAPYNFYSMIKHGVRELSNTPLMAVGATHGAGVYVAPQWATALAYSQQHERNAPVAAPTSGGSSASASASVTPVLPRWSSTTLGALQSVVAACEIRSGPGLGIVERTNFCLVIPDACHNVAIRYLVVCPKQNT